MAILKFEKKPKKERKEYLRKIAKLVITYLGLDPKREEEIISEEITVIDKCIEEGTNFDDGVLKAMLSHITKKEQNEIMARAFMELPVEEKIKVFRVVNKGLKNNKGSYSFILNELFSLIMIEDPDLATDVALKILKLLDIGNNLRELESSYGDAKRPKLMLITSPNNTE